MSRPFSALSDQHGDNDCRDSISNNHKNTFSKCSPFLQRNANRIRRQETVRNLSRTILLHIAPRLCNQETAIAAQYRELSSDNSKRANGHGNNDREDDKSKRSTQQEKGTKQSASEKRSVSQPMDKDFEKYLQGSGSSSDMEESPYYWLGNATTTTPRSSRRPRLKQFDRESADIYANILNKKKETARLKTRQTVNMALMGNCVICVAKLGAWVSSGSSGMLAEFIHSMVDCGNQGLLLLGLRDSQLSADRSHPYGYGKSVYFWALVSALGTFFLGAGVSMTNAVADVMDPKLQEITWEVWSVLVLSLTVDGFVLAKTLGQVNQSKPKNLSLWQHLQKLRDPATLAILLEDGAACLGVIIAFGGIIATHQTGNPVFDGMAGVGISTLLGGMGLILASMNYRFLLGQAVDKEIIEDIAKMLTNRKSIDSIGQVQSQWTGPETFSYKAEVDFDGTYIAAELMTVRNYQNEFKAIKDTMDTELKVLLSLYAEDVMRAVEREVKTVEAMIRKKYPGAEYIELEPMSKDADRLAIDDNLEANLYRMESESLDRYLRGMKTDVDDDTAATEEAVGATDAPVSASPPERK